MENAEERKKIKKIEKEEQLKKKLEEKSLPETVDYTQIRGLRLEAAEKLNAHRPANIGQASRISGVSPADISVLLVWETALQKGEQPS